MSAQMAPAVMTSVIAPVGPALGVAPCSSGGRRELGEAVQVVVIPHDHHAVAGA
jgi:hypothetical protein